MAENNNNNNNNNDNNSGDKKVIYNNGIPLEQYEEVLNNYKETKEKLETFESQINEYSKKIEETESQYQARLKELEQKYVKTLYKSTGVKDTDYLDFLVSKAIQEAGGELDYEKAIEKVKEQKPDLFEPSKKMDHTPGNKPFEGLTPKKFKEMSATERAELYKKDPELYHKLKKSL